MARPKKRRPLAGDNPPEQARGSPTRDVSQSWDIEHLVNLDRLLNAAHDLMKQEPSLDRAAFEHLRQLKVRVRFAISAASRDHPTKLPRIAPALYENRKDPAQSPLDFTKITYAQWLHKNISRAEIRKLDKKLYNAYFNWKITSEQLDSIGLPTKQAVIEKKLKAAGPLKRPPQTVRMSELPPEERELARLWHVARRRKR